MGVYEVAMNRRSVVLGLGAFGLSACAGPNLVLTPGPAGGGAPLFIGTTRVLNPVDSWPTQEPGQLLRRMEVSVAFSASDAAQGRALKASDVGRGPVRLLDDRRAFQQRLREDARRRGAREALVFVHGYNNTIDSSVLRAAQVSQTFGVAAVPVHFAWASAGAPLAYVADRDAALLARDGLEAVLEDIQLAGLRAVVLAHSMGAMVVMEVIRQMSIAGRKPASSIAGVFLVAPDIDVALFRSQLDRIPLLPQPFVVLTNRRDRALALSRGLSGRRERLGSLGDPALLADFSITLIDATAITQARDHFPVVNSPVVAGIFSDFAQVPGAFEDPASARDLLAGTVLGIRSVTQVVLSPVGL
jgi:esterase/lipase superfamily enzyme